MPPLHITHFQWFLSANFHLTTYYISELKTPSNKVIIAVPSSDLLTLGYSKFDFDLQINMNMMGVNSFRRSPETDR